jgi:Flp pilus assembly protein TadB
VKAFLADRLNRAWLVSGLVLVAVLLLVPNDGLGTIVLIVVAAVAIGLSGAARIRDAKRDRERKANDPRRKRRPRR